MKNLGFLAFCFASFIVGTGSQPATEVNTGVRLPPSIISFWCLSANTYGNTSNYFGAGVSFEFQCQAGGVPAPMYTWKHNGITIVSNGTSVLIVEQPTSGDAGEYVCEAWNDWGTAVSNIITMQMAVISAFPATNKIVNSFQVAEYDPLMLPCQGAPNSVPAPKYVWYRIPNNKPIQPDSRIQIDESGNLYFAYVELRDATGPDEWYTCVLQNSFLRVMVGGSETTVNVSKSTSVEETVPAVAFYSGPFVSTFRGEQVTLNCFFFGYPTPSIVWQLPNNQSTYSTTSDGTRLTIDNFQGTDVGEYTCLASNSNSEAFNVQVSVNVSIEGAVPVFESSYLQPTNTNVTNGQTVSFVCDPAAQPTSTIVWLQNGFPLDVSNLPSNMSISVDRTTLTVTNVCKDCPGGATDLMVLQCNATNVYGYAYAEGYLNVLLQTSIVDYPQNQVISGSDSGSVSFTCSATSDPSTPVSITWIYNNSTVDNQFVVSYDVTGDVTSTTLTISSAQTYVGTYTCLAWNGYSRAEASATLTVAESPTPATQTSTATPTTTTSTGTVPSSTSSRPTSTSTGSISNSTSSTSTGVISTSTSTIIPSNDVISTSTIIPTSPSSTSTGVISTSTITPTSPSSTSTSVVSTSTITTTIPSSTSTSSTSMSTILSSGTQTMLVPSSTVYSSASLTPPSTTYFSSTEHVTSGPPTSPSSEPETSTPLPTSHANHIINISESTSVGPPSPSPSSEPETSSTPLPTSHANHIINISESTSVGPPSPSSEPETSSTPLTTIHNNHISLNFSESTSVGPPSPSSTTPPFPSTTSFLSIPFETPSPTTPASSTPQSQTMTSSFPYFPSSSISPSSSIGFSSSTPPQTPVPSTPAPSASLSQTPTPSLPPSSASSSSFIGSSSSTPPQTPSSSSTSSPSSAPFQFSPSPSSVSTINTTIPAFTSSSTSGLSSSFPGSTPTPGRRRINEIMTKIAHIKLMIKCGTSLSTSTPGTGSPTGNESSSSSLPDSSTTGIPGNRIRDWIRRHRSGEAESTTTPSLPSSVSSGMYSTSIPTSNPTTGNHREGLITRWIDNHRSVNIQSTTTSGSSVNSSATPRINRIKIHLVRFKLCAQQAWQKNQEPKNVSEPTSTAQQPSNTTSTPNKHNLFDWIRNRQATNVPTVPTSNTSTGVTQIPSTTRSPLANMRVRLHQIMLRSCLAQTTLHHQPYEPTSTTVEARHRFLEDRTALDPRRKVSDPTPASTSPGGSESPTPTTNRHFRLRNFNFCSQA